MKNPVLALLLILLPLDAQAHQTDLLPKQGMVLAGGRVAGVPTPATALRALMAQETARAPTLLRPYCAKCSIPARQLSWMHSLLSSNGIVRRRGPAAQSYPCARLALILRCGRLLRRGHPVCRSGGCLHTGLRVVRQSRADPRAVDALYGIFYAGGTDYVRDLFKASEKPSKPCFQTPSARVPAEDPPPKEEWCPHKSVWCTAGDILLYGRSRDPAAPDPGVWKHLCYRDR